MAADQIELEAVDGFVGDSHFAELAETGVDAVDRTVAVGSLADNAFGSGHLGYGVGGEFDAGVAVCDGGKIGEGQRLSTKLQHLCPE